MADWLPPNIVDSVSAQVDNAWGLVTTAFDQGLNSLNTLGAQEYDISWELTAVENVNDPGINVSTPSIPALEDIPELDAEFDGEDVSVDNVNITSLDIPGFEELPYTLNIPGAPYINWPTFYKDSPGASDISIPTAPSFNIPEVPTLSGVTIPSPPEYSIPSFTDAAPVEDLTVPALSFNWGESLYSSDLKTKLGDWLYDNLVAGGSGLDEDTEQAIYDRAKSRMEDEEQELLDSVNDNMASTGFPLPTGSYASRVLSAENKVLRTRTDLNNDILVQQSKLAQENMHLFVQEATKLETVLIDYYSQVQNRSLDATKFVITTSETLYNLKVTGYQARVQAYGILAQVYQAKIQGEIAKAEFYRAQIDGVQASVAVQNLLIEAYRSQISGIAALVDVYRSQMEGANIQASIDRTRMEGFLAEVQAYTARVNGEAAKYEGYKAAIAGEAAKVDMQRVHAETYLAKLSGTKLTLDSQLSIQEAKLSKTKADIEVFNGYVQKYLADVQASVNRAEIVAKKEGLKATVFGFQGEMYRSEIDALVRAYLGKIDEVKNKTDSSIRESEVAIQTLISKYQLTSENLRAIAQVAGQMASAAAASVNASLSASHSDSNSAANSGSFIDTENKSTSESYSVIEETIHQYSN